VDKENVLPKTSLLPFLVILLITLFNKQKNNNKRRSERSNSITILAFKPRPSEGFLE